MFWVSEDCINWTDYWRSFWKGDEKDMKKNKALVLELNIDNNGYVFPNTISDAFVDANNELFDLGIKLSETLEAIKVLTPECDKYDYILSALRFSLLVNPASPH